ncbi:MAG: DUF2207 domain-containing protein [Saprospiraceae bacterium]|nr:DUF2207 domain-containing protein [Saprospiraceae bacterium]
MLPSKASAEYFTIRNYDVDIKISSEGYFEVTETISVDFSEPRRGIFRMIPYKYKLQDEVRTIKIKDVDVNGFRFKTYTEGNNFVVRIGDPDVYVNGQQVYVIRYKVSNAFLLLVEHTEFYWNLVGEQWPVNIDAVQYTVQFDKFITLGTDDYKILAGAAGSQDQNANIRYQLNKVVGETTVGLGPNEGVTIAVKLPVDYIRRPTEMEQFLAKYGMSGLGLLLLSLISGFFYRLWSKYGKDYPIVRMVQYVPPKELTPSEAGVIIDEKADNIDIMALLPYWAHQGYIQIKRIPKKWAKDDHELIKIKPLSHLVPAYETVVFNGIFRSGDEVLISSLQEKFYTDLAAAKTELKNHINKMDIYYPVSIQMQIYLGIGSFVVLVLAVLSMILIGSVILALSLGISGIIGLIFTSLMLKKNQNGVRLYQEVLGFKMFVEKADKDRLERMLKDDPDYFEKTLPYAMVFGYVKQWSSKFDGLLTEPPRWYIGGPGYMHGGFTPSAFGSSFDTGMKEIQSAFSSAPQSSGGGGFSGGGSVGGGFGGGGGGSW